MMKDERTLMQRLLDAGYPREKMDHHGSDLYVYVTPLTQDVINKWCRDKGLNRKWMCPIFKDQITGKPMYDCTFAYDDHWMEMAAKGEV